MKTVAGRLYSLAVGFFRRRSSASGSDLGGVNAGSKASMYILFIPLSAPLHELETDWAKDCDSAASEDA